MITLTKTNSIHRSPLLRGLLLIPLLLACFALLPRVQAAPDPAAIPGGNTRDGAGSLASRTTGTNNSAFGTNALNKLTMGNNNAAQGNSAQFSLTDGNKNTALGVLALRLNISGDDNTAVGYKALYNSTNNDNVAVGSQALFTNIQGDRNTAIGFQALFSSDTNDNTAVGDSALASTSTGAFNTAVGSGALSSNSSGNSNIALGELAGSAVTTGNFNIDIGNAGAAEHHTIRIGVTSGGNAQTDTYIAGIFGQNVSAATDTPVIIDSSGKLGTATSSQRFKKDIKPMDQASDAILKLKPVTFHYKSDPSGFPRFGLVAEDVAKVSPDLIVRDADGQILTVRYEAVNAMLLNEFLKEHCTVEELKSTAAKQEATIAKQQKQIEALSTGLQKVSDQLEISRPAPQMVANDQ